MKRKLLVPTILLATALTYAQNLSLEDWKSRADAYLENRSNEGRQSKGGDLYQAVLISNSNSDMYFEGFGMLWGLYRTWQATGEFSYLDKALDIVDADIDGAVNTADYYEQFPDRKAGQYYTPALPYKSNLGLPNYYKAKYNYEYPIDGSFNYWLRPLGEYIRQDIGSPFAYNYITATQPDLLYAVVPLNENIYYRFVADMLRVMNNNSEILGLTSNNGQSYQERLNRILGHLETHIWEKYVEYEINPKQKEWYVYRVNTHMSSHLASVALSLYTITGKSKYLSFVEDFLYDFGTNPDAVNIPPGVGFLDQMELDSGGALVWTSQWGKRVGQTAAQDIAHAGPEFAFLVQCYEEGIGANPPPGHIPIDDAFMEALVRTVKNNVIIGDPRTSTQFSYRIDQGGNSWFQSSQYAQGLHVMAEFDPDLLRFLENNNYGSDMKMSNLGHGAYAAGVLGVNDSQPVVYPSMGNGSRDGANNCPRINLRGEALITLELDANYEEQGAVWTDVEDGTGEAEITFSNVDTSISGTYTVTYAYEDSEGCRREANRTIEVSAPGNDCPVIEINGAQTIRLEVGENYNEPGATWTDTEDGTGPADIGGDTVNTQVAGTYQVVYSYTDSGGCRRETTRSVVVSEADPDFVPVQSFRWEDDRYVIDIGETVLPPFTITPSNPTIPFVWVESSDTDVASVDPNGYLTGLSAGIITITATTLDGTNISDTIELEVVDPNAGGILIESFRWVDDFAVVAIGREEIPAYEMNPANPTLPLFWVQSNNLDVATIDANGKIVGQREGFVTITGSTLDGSRLSDDIEVQIIDALPEIRVSNPSVNEGEPLVFQIEFSRPLQVDIPIRARLTDRGALEGVDYQASSQADLILPAGQTRITFDVNTFVDNEVEENERLDLIITVGRIISYVEEEFSGTGTILGNSVEENGDSAYINLSFAPNPARPGETITVSQVEDGPASLIIYSIAGAEVYSQLIEVNNGRGQISMPRIPPGFYIISLSNKVSRYSGKLVIN